MRINNNGLGAVGVLAVIALIVVGAAGAYMWQNKDKNSVNSFEQCETALYGDVVRDVYYPTCSYKGKTFNNPIPSGTNDNSVLLENYQNYSDSNVSLQYPAEWTKDQEANKPEWVFFKSPDYTPAEGQGPSVTSGYLLEVSVNTSSSNESYEEDLKSAEQGQQAHGGTYETIKIDGQNALLSNTKTHGSYWYATAYANNKTYYFRLNALDETKPEVKELLKLILSTVTLK